MDYIHEQIEKMNMTSMNRGQQPLASLLSPDAIDHLEDLSGCHLRVSLIYFIHFISLQHIGFIITSKRLTSTDTIYFLKAQFSKRNFYFISFTIYVM